MEEREIVGERALPLSKMVRRRCATNTLVRSFSFRIEEMFPRRACSVWVSRAEVCCEYRRLAVWVS